MKVLSGERKYPSRNTYIHIYAKILLQIFVIFFSQDFFFWQSKSNSSQVNKTYELCVCCFGQEIFNRFPLYVDVTAPERAERKKTENNEKNLAVISKDFANESRRTQNVYFKLTESMCHMCTNMIIMAIVLASEREYYK